MKPIIFYVDDEPMNLVVFEAVMPDDWEIKTFDNPEAALAALVEFSPHVIVSDQKMPRMVGVEFLGRAKVIRPNAVRMIVTGYSDEELVVQSVRKAQIFDYIKKPWDPAELETSLQRAVDFFETNEANRTLTTELQRREQLLTEQNANLNQVLHALERAKQSESRLRQELECWVPPFVQWAVQQGDLKFPLSRDITGITFDIIGSSSIHDVIVHDRPVRSTIIHLFSECILRHNGWRESHSGDSAYGHFGLENSEPSADRALAVAKEFCDGLKTLNESNSVKVECGVALHFIRGAKVDVHTVRMDTDRGAVVQKSFDTTSTDVDLLHRIEKLAHELPGSNIIMSDQFVAELRNPPPALEDIGSFRMRGQSRPVKLHIIRSYLTQDKDVAALRAKSLEITGSGTAA